MNLASNLPSNSTYSNIDGADESSPVFCFPYPNHFFETIDNNVPYLVNASLNVPSAILAIFLNILVFLAVTRRNSIRLPSKLLLCTLIVTDLGVGLVVQPQTTASLIMKANKDTRSVRCSMAKICGFFSSVLSCVSVLTMTAISLDRYVALFLHQKYNQTVTLRRVSGVLCFIWSAAIFYALTPFWDWKLSNYLSFAFGVICPIVISVVYIKIYRELRRGNRVQDQEQVQPQQKRGNTLNVTKYRRSASAMFWVYALFMLCYLPGIFAAVIMSFFPKNALFNCIIDFLYTVLLLNSCLNPFVYCLRLPEIRGEIRVQVRKFFCRSS